MYVHRFDVAFKRNIGTGHRTSSSPNTFSVVGAFAICQIKTTHFSFFWGMGFPYFGSQLRQLGPPEVQAASHTPWPSFHCRSHSFHHRSPDKASDFCRDSRHGPRSTTRNVGITMLSMVMTGGWFTIVIPPLLIIWIRWS